MKQTLNRVSNALLTILFLSIAMLLVASLTSCSPKVALKAPDVPLPSWFPVDDPTEIGQTYYDYDTVQWVKFMQRNGNIIKINLDSLMNSGKVVVDTVLLAAEEVVIHDSIPCPGGLDGETMVSFRIVKQLPQRPAPVSFTVLDTVWLARPCPPKTAATVAGQPNTWGERAAWLLGILTLLLGYFNQWRKKGQSKAS